MFFLITYVLSALLSKGEEQLNIEIYLFYTFVLNGELLCKRSQIFPEHSAFNAMRQEC